MVATAACSTSPRAGKHHANSSTFGSRTEKTYHHPHSRHYCMTRVEWTARSFTSPAALLGYLPTLPHPTDESLLCQPPRSLPTTCPPLAHHLPPRLDTCRLSDSCQLSSLYCFVLQRTVHSPQKILRQALGFHHQSSNRSPGRGGAKAKLSRATDIIPQ